MVKVKDGGVSQGISLVDSDQADGLINLTSVGGGGRIEW